MMIGVYVLKAGTYPLDDEWTDLITYLDVNADPDGHGTQSYFAGGKMKSTGTIQDGDGLWNYYSDEVTEGATNESGFTGIPGGIRSTNDGYYYSMGVFGSLWSSSECSDPTLQFCSYTAFWRGLSWISNSMARLDQFKGNGFSIRCLGD